MGKDSLMTISQLNSKVHSLLVEDIIPINKYSHVGRKIDKELFFTIHWPANPKKDAWQTNQYFKGLADQDPTDKKVDRYASTHFSLDHEKIVVGIPVNGFLGYRKTNKAYHAGAFYDYEIRKKYGGSGSMYTSWAKSILKDKRWKNANNYSVGVEVSHTDWKGNMENKTIANLVLLAAYWCCYHDRNPMTAIKLHNDWTSKLCPRYYVDNPEEFETLKKYIYDLTVEVGRVKSF